MRTLTAMTTREVEWRPAFGNGGRRPCLLAGHGMGSRFASSKVYRNQDRLYRMDY